MYSKVPEHAEHLGHSNVERSACHFTAQNFRQLVGASINTQGFQIGAVTTPASTAVKQSLKMTRKLECAYPKAASPIFLISTALVFFGDTDPTSSCQTEVSEAKWGKETPGRSLVVSQAARV